MGPLRGIRVVELTGIGPGPLCGMLLADMGAEVLRVDRAEAVRADRATTTRDLLARGRRSVAVDLKHPDGVETVLRLAEQADVLFEGYRPGVAERLGIGPEPCLGRNPRLVYGRMTGWGQDGPLSQAAGHDIDYIALAGALDPIGRRGQGPVPPLNLVGDFGGGGMLLAYGITCALVERSTSGRGQVVDAAMVDGAGILMTFFHALRAVGMWTDERGANLLDSGAPFYDAYETADGRYVAVGAIEPQFYAELLERVGLDPDELGPQMDRDRWPAAKERVAALFRTRTRDEWCELLEGTDACFAPVLGLGEVHEHPHHRARDAYLEVEGIVQPAPAPRFDRTPGAIHGPPPHPGDHTDTALADWGFSAEEVAGLRGSGAVA
ncbi:MAG: CoA transferase [Acidimicrobiia bacterium]|nr:CoA transferase [Acidimicrobiia bacterium]